MKQPSTPPRRLCGATSIGCGRYHPPEGFEAITHAQGLCPGCVLKLTENWGVSRANLKHLDFAITHLRTGGKVYARFEVYKVLETLGVPFTRKNATTHAPAVPVDSALPAGDRT